MFSPSRLPFWELSEGVGTIVVILGVAGEFVAEFTRFLNGKAAKKKFEKCSVLVLIFGLAIELLAHSVTSHISGVITAGLNEEAGNARKAAGEAIERAEELRKKNIELESKLQPRMITQEQREKFIDSLKSSPKGPIRIQYGNPNNETWIFIFQLRGMLDEAGFGVGDSTALMPNPTGSVNHSYITGIAILAYSMETSPPYLSNIEQAFKEIGITTYAIATKDGNYNLKPNPGEIVIFVTEKPL